MLSALSGNFKQHSAPGEVCVNGLSDRGSTPLASNRTVFDEHFLFLRRLCRKGDDLIHKTETPSCESKAVFLISKTFDV